MGRKKPTAGEIYRHFRGKKYRILHLAVSTETKQEMVVYEAADGDGKVYVSILGNFMGTVNREKYADAVQNYRFELVSEAEDEELFEDLEEAEAEAEVLEDEREISDGKSSMLNADSSESYEEKQYKIQKKSIDSNDSEKTSMTNSEKLSEEHAMILEYLDLDTEEEKLQYLQKHRNELTDRFLTAAAESMDYAERGESPEERYAEIVRCLKTKMRYESGRRR